MEWPPSCHQLMVFSSRTGRWEERAFVRIGEAAGTVADVRSNMVVDHNWKTGYSYAEYWRGALYVHCRAGAFVSRFCTSECSYQVIKAPTNMDENENMRSNFRRSEKGMHYASFRGHRLRVWILLEESHGLPEWVLKYDVSLNLLSYRMNTLYSEEINRPWTVDDDDREKQENNRQSAEWNSDNDDVLEYGECSHEQQSRGGFRFLGFHPYKEDARLHPW
ncbi:uncharacterized protein [Triticum aestivum]|uniref:uncharacterized protein n=1 Tax=Triticum aestivum TaxID=4565 RepID=UPI001D01D9B9|nr:uncharacterized protein LOC123084059 [Triticum aestivum]